MRRRTAVSGAIGLAAMAAIGGLLLTSGAQQQALAAQRSQVSTATVRRGELSATVSVDGTLSYGARSDGSPYSVINEAKGAYTKLPAVGQVARQGQVLYSVNDNPVVLLYGSTPTYRTLSAGVSGPDVAELNADLVALGYATRAQFGPTSTYFGSATTAAVEKLQAAVGLAQTGALALGQAVFEPTAVRVTAVSALLGGHAHAGELVMQGTSTKREVEIALDAAQQTDVAVGDKVSITLPNNKTTLGVVSTVGTVATCAASSGSSSSSAALAADSCSSNNSAAATPAINVDIALSDPAVTGSWDQAPVQVGITTDRVPSALTVPVDALLARSNGGYAVEVVRAGGVNHLVSVSLGLFDDAEGLVQVTGAGLGAGQKVVVPTT